MAKNTTNNNYRSKAIELALPKFSSEEDAKGVVDDVWERFPVSIQKITDCFNSTK